MSLDMIIKKSANSSQKKRDAMWGRGTIGTTHFYKMQDTPISL